MQRRKFLKLAGASSALSAIPVASGAELDDLEKFKRVVKKSSRIRANEGKDGMKQWLENQPVDAGFSNHKLPVSLGPKAENIGTQQTEDDSIGTQQIEDGSIIIDIGLYNSYYTPSVSATLDFYYDLELDSWTAPYGCGTDKISYGDNPKDAAAMTWNTDHYEAISIDRFDATHATEYVETATPYQTGQGGHNTGKIGFRINDYQASADWIDIDAITVACETDETRVYAGQAALFLTQIGDYDPSERLVRGGYNHAYDAGEPNVGASLSIPAGAGVTLTGANENIKEQPIIEDRNGDDIVITGDETESGP